MQMKAKNLGWVCLLIFLLTLGCNLDNGSIGKVQAVNSLLTSRAAPPTKYKITYFWVYSPEDEPVDMTSPLVDMLDFNDQVIATIPQAVAERIAMEGTGFLPADPLYVEPDSKAGALLNLANDEGWPRSRFIELDKALVPWGMTNMGESLVPYWTVAVDPAVFPLRTIIYVPAYDGYVLPAGFTTVTGSSVHDGLFYCGDISWSFKGKQIDIFPATYSNWQDSEQFLPSTSRVPIEVFATPAPYPAPDLDHSFPGDKIEIEDYNLGGEGIAYHDRTTGNDGGVYRSEDVDIEYCTDIDAGYNVGWPAEGEWLAYTVAAVADAIVSLDIRVAAWSDAQSLHVEIDDVDVTGLMAIPNTGYWQAWETITKDNIFVTAGSHTVKLFMHGDGFNLNWMQFRSGGPAVTATPAPTGTPVATDTPAPTVTPAPGPTGPPGANPGDAAITTFKDDKKGAYSPTYDDGLWESMTIVFGIHQKYNIVGTVCINTLDWVTWYPDKWQDLNGWLDSGLYRLGSHSHTHPHYPALAEADLRWEIQYSNELLFTNTGYKVESMAWPFNDWDQPTADIVGEYYVAARDSDTFQLDQEPTNGGERPEDPRYLALRAYVFGNKYKLSAMNAWIDTAITNGKWLTVNYHGVDHDGWSPIDSIRLADHYAYVDSRSADIWVEGLAEVGKYLKEMNASTLNVLSADPAGIELEVNHSLVSLPVMDSTDSYLMYTVDYDYPLTVKLYVYSDWNTVQVLQGSRTDKVPVYDENGSAYVLVDVVPNSGSAIITKLN